MRAAKPRFATVRRATPTQLAAASASDAALRRSRAPGRSLVANRTLTMAANMVTSTYGQRGGNQLR